MLTVPAELNRWMAKDAQKPGILGDYHIGWWEFLTGLKFLAEVPEA